MMLLDCGSTSGREWCVSDEHVMEASRFLALLQNDGLDEITERRKLQYFLARSDPYYRLSNYQAAARYAYRALEVAQKYGFRLEEMPARDQIYHNRQLLDEGGVYVFQKLKLSLKIESNTCYFPGFTKTCCYKVGKKLITKVSK